MGGGTGMLYYRLYFMSARTGHILRFAEYEAPDDAAATALAGEQEGEHALELWCRDRRVAGFEPSDRLPCDRTGRRVAQPAMVSPAGFEPATY